MTLKQLNLVNIQNGYFLFSIILLFRYRRNRKSRKNVSFEEECEIQENEDEWYKKRRKSFPLDFSFASFRDISQGYIQYECDSKEREDYQHSFKQA